MNEFLLKKATYFYYNRLSQEEKKLYQTILVGMLNFTTDIKITGSFGVAHIKRVMEYISNDRPDIFWAGSTYSYSTRNHIVVSVSPDYLYTKAQAENVAYRMKNSQFYREMCAGLSAAKQEVDKALFAYEYIIQHTEYDMGVRSSKNANEAYAFLMFGVVLNHKAVCAGYAKTFLYFMNKFNVNCLVVSGVAKGERHAWNMLSLHGDYYYVDTTWGDPIFHDATTKNPDYISYDYFCITTQELMQSHRPVFDEPMPVCTATQCNYYRYFDLYEEHYSVENVANHIINARRKGKREAMIKYANATVYRQAKQRLFEASEIFRALSMAQKYCVGLNCTQTRYATDDERNIVTIKLKGEQT